MRSPQHIDEDLALKRAIATPHDQKPRFDWRGVVQETTPHHPNGNGNGAQTPAVDADTADAEFEGLPIDVSEIAEIVGHALTDLLIARQQRDKIDTERNRRLVATVAREVFENIATGWEKNPGRRFSPQQINLIIENSLISHDAYDIARSLVARRGYELAVHGEDAGDGEPTRERASTRAHTGGPVTVRLIRRNGMVVPWDPNKVEIAVRKAFLSLKLDSSAAVDVATAVTERVRSMGQAFINIEDVQDLVQEELMRAGFFKVAETYILYRAHRSRLRDAEAQVDLDDVRQDALLTVRDDDGNTFLWDGSELRKRMDFALIGLDLCLSRDEIEAELRRSLYPEMTREELKRTLILNAKTLIERDADFTKFAGRILLTYVYEEVLDWSIERDGLEGLKRAHQDYFRTYIFRGIELERLSDKVATYNLAALADALDPSADLDFDYLGIQTLYDRYLIVDKTQKPARRLETPQIFFMRVAMGLFHGEAEDKEDWAIRLYKLYKSRRFCSSTPTLFNSGTLHSQLSSCYLYKVDDSLESIMQRGIAENAMLSKWAGGLGGSWTSVRGTGSYIKGTNGESQGVIPFLKLHNDQLVAVNQGGKRRGSGCAYLETWHNDIYDFLELRRNTGDDRRRTHDMNTANWIPDLFMKRMEAREDWTLFRSSETADLHELYGRAFEERYLEYERRAAEGKIWGKQIPAIDLWKRMLSMLFETGHPWITFKDACNVRSPQDHAGVIHSSNLCTEITLNTSEAETAVCNLGSVVLDTHLDADGNLDLEKLRETVQIAVRALDRVIDINYYPTEAAERSNKRHRPIGLGVMGLQNALYKRGISFASPEAVEFNDEFMEAIAYYAYEASSDIAAEKGTYETYKGSKWDRGLLPQDTLDLLGEERGEAVDVPRGGRLDWQPLREKIARQGMRNSNVLAIAPTATISNIMGTTPCIEPAYKNIYVKSNLSGEFVVLNAQLVRDLKARDLWSEQMLEKLKYFDGELASISEIPLDLRERYVTAFGIQYDWFIDAAARRQKWIDQAQSVNLFLGSPDLKTLSHMYRAAWRKGLKTTYYLRTLGASNIEKATVSVKKEVRGRAGTVEVKAVLAEGLPTAAESATLSQETAAPAATIEEKNQADPQQQCRLDAMINGGECEACQ
ncbi:MAG: ribonucleoside-diphosphate reductase subunit alpha [Opitutales bacterium]